MPFWWSTQIGRTKMCTFWLRVRPLETMREVKNLLTSTKTVDQNLVLLHHDAVQTVDIFFGDVVAARHLSSWQLATGQLCGGHLGVGTWTESWPHLIHSSHMLFTLGGSHHPEGLDARHLTHTQSALSAHLIFHNPRALLA